MLCDSCKEREWEIHLTKVENDTKVTLRLCKQCAEQKGLRRRHALSETGQGFLQDMGRLGFWLGLLLLLVILYAIAS
jgi:protein-arginine kinase activator protein McsA